MNSGNMTYNSINVKQLKSLFILQKFIYVFVVTLQGSSGLVFLYIWLVLGNHLNHIAHINGGSLLVFQLQLQRNEVIALMNLLNRLSESVKFVHDKGPYAERIVGGKISSPTSKNSL